MKRILSVGGFSLVLLVAVGWFLHRTYVSGRVTAAAIELSGRFQPSGNVRVQAEVSAH